MSFGSKVIQLTNVIKIFLMISSAFLVTLLGLFIQFHPDLTVIIGNMRTASSLDTIFGVSLLIIITFFPIVIQFRKPVQTTIGAIDLNRITYFFSLISIVLLFTGCVSILYTFYYWYINTFEGVWQLRFFLVTKTANLETKLQLYTKITNDLIIVASMQDPAFGELLKSTFATPDFKALAKMAYAQVPDFVQNAFNNAHQLYFDKKSPETWGAWLWSVKGIIAIPVAFLIIYYLRTELKASMSTQEQNNTEDLKKLATKVETLVNEVETLKTTERLATSTDLLKKIGGVLEYCARLGRNVDSIEKRLSLHSIGISHLQTDYMADKELRNKMEHETNVSQAYHEIQLECVVEAIKTNKQLRIAYNAAEQAIVAAGTTNS